MCGIAGFYNYRDDQLISKISKQLRHRGPDGEGFFIDNNVTLLNRRLAIIDLKTGDQPIYNEDRNIVVVYNGEIYNFKELRHQLEKTGHKFSTESDTEVIVHGYEKWGEKCFDKFNGMFAIALYDKKKEKLVLARDHFGIKPLYYAFIRGSSGNTEIRFSKSLFARDTYQIIFSSEIKPIFESGLIEKKPNDKIIYRYLKYRIHDDQKETFFKGIYRLMPGELMIVQSSRFKVQSFTNLKEELSNIKETKKLGNYEILNFKKKLIEAIKLRLISDVPVGTCLSGGLDSSTVVAIINNLLKENIKETQSIGKIQKTFSAVFPGEINDEEKYIDNLVNQLTGSWVNVFKIYPKPEEFFKEIKEFIKTQEEPTISTGPYAQYKVMEKVPEQVKVVLDGQGADEMIAGYIPYYYVYLRQLFNEKKYFTLLKEFYTALDLLIKIPINRLIGILGLRKEILIKSLLNPNIINKFKHEKFTVINDNLKKRLIEDIFYNSLPSLLRYEDRNSMKFSVEGRVPFLDFNLMKYLFSLPDEAIIKNGWNKNILRQATKELLPKTILKRRNKIGFTTPEYQWFMRMKNRIYQIFLSESFANRSYFNQQEVLKAFQLFVEGKVDDTMLFWRLLNLELWLRVFFDVKIAKPLKSSRVNEFAVNQGKKLEISIYGKKYTRYPIRTELFKKGDDYIKKITNQLLQCFKTSKWKMLGDKKFFLVISEKIIAVSQGRSYFIWEIKTGFWANLLNRFVKKTPFGIGLGSPWTMQLAINEVGLPKILLATVLSAVTKPLGIKGVFYKIAGSGVAAIDGPTEYSLYPSNVSAKLGPKNPQKVAENFKFQISNFQGVVIIDANDLGQKVLGNSTDLDNKLIERIFSDNPMGQADEQTPLVVVAIR